MRIFTTPPYLDATTVRLRMTPVTFGRALESCALPVQVSTKLDAVFPSAQSRSTRTAVRQVSVVLDAS